MSLWLKFTDMTERKMEGGEEQDEKYENVIYLMPVNLYSGIFVYVSFLSFFLFVTFTLSSRKTNLRRSNVACDVSKSNIVNMSFGVQCTVVVNATYVRALQHLAVR